MTNSSESRLQALPPRPDTRRFIPAIRLADGLTPASRPDRFIPREEIGSVERWTMPALGGAAPSMRPAAARASSLTPDQWQSKVAAARAEGAAQGHRQGYEEGYRDGLAALEGFKQRHVEEIGQRFAALADALGQQLEAVEQQAAQAVAATAVQLARQVLRQALQTQPELVVGVAREAVNAVMMTASHIAVRVHPDDHELIARGAAEALKARGASLVPDARIRRGGCRVDSDVGSVDATIEARWAAAAAAMGQPVALDDEQLPATGQEGSA
jgi:flagellar assembly protein FliH